MPGATAQPPAQDHSGDDFGDFVSTASGPSASASLASSSSSTSSLHASSLPSSAMPSSFVSSSSSTLTPVSHSFSVLTPTAPAAGSPASLSSSSSSNAFSSLASSYSASSSAGGSSSATVNSFFSSIMRPAATVLSSVPPTTPSAPPAAPKRPSLNALASGPAAASRPDPLNYGAASSSLLEPSVSSHNPSSSFSSSSSLSAEFEEFVSAPKASLPLLGDPLGITPSPPLGGGAASHHSPLPTASPLPAVGAAAQSPALAASLAYPPSSSTSAAAASDFELFFSSPSSNPVTPPASQASVFSSSALTPTLSSPASAQSSYGPASSGLGGDDDWSFSSAAAPEATSLPPPSVQMAGPSASATSDLDAMMHKFSNIEKRTLAGEAAKKPEHAVNQQHQSTQMPTAKHQSTRAFNWNDDSYKSIFASIATETPQPKAAAPTVDSAADDDFGDFVSERASASADAGSTTVQHNGFHSYVGSYSQSATSPAAQFEGVQSLSGFAAAFPTSSLVSAGDYNTASATTAYHPHVMAAMSSSVPLQASAAQPAPSQEEDWTSFATSHSSAAPPAVAVVANLSSSLPGLSFGPSSSASSSASFSSSTVLPFSVSSIPTASSTNGGVPLLPSPVVARKEAQQQQQKTTRDSSSEFGSFASFPGGDSNRSAAAAPLDKATGQVDWQEQTLRQCLVHLQQGCVLFQQLIEVSNGALRSKTLQSEKVDAYILGLCEVYKIGRRVGKLWRSDMAKELAPQLEDAWVVFREVIAGLDFKPSIDLQRWQDQLEKSDKHAWSGRARCPLCLAPVTPLEAQIQLQNALYHAPCANFYSSLRQIPSSASSFAF